MVWENNTTPIIGGREQTGIPKVFANIEDLHILKPRYSTAASLNGNTFLNLNFETTGKIIGQELEAVKSLSSSVNTIGWRYIPNVGKSGAELSQFIIYPQGINVDSAYKGNCKLKWTESDPMKNPSQFHIINSLATLPIKNVNEGLLTEGFAILRAFGASIIK